MLPQGRDQKNLMISRGIKSQGTSSEFQLIILKDRITQDILNVANLIYRFRSDSSLNQGCRAYNKNNGIPCCAFVCLCLCLCVCVCFFRCWWLVNVSFGSEQRLQGQIPAITCGIREQLMCRPHPDPIRSLHNMLFFWIKAVLLRSWNSVTHSLALNW